MDSKCYQLWNTEKSTTRKGIIDKRGDVLDEENTPADEFPWLGYYGRSLVIPSY